MYKAVLFDMDGTVLDTVGDLTDAINVSLEKFGFPARSQEEVKSFLGKGPAHFVNCAVPEGTDAATKQQVLAFYEPYYDSHCQIRTAPYPGIMDLLKTLKARGIRLAVISNKQEPAVKALTGQILVAYALVVPFKVMNMILDGGIIRSGGQTQYSMAIDLIGTWGFGVPLGLLAGFVLKLSIPYVYFILSLEECVRFAISLVIFRKRLWMRRLSA